MQQAVTTRPCFPVVWTWDAVSHLGVTNSLVHPEHCNLAHMNGRYLPVAVSVPAVVHEDRRLLHVRLVVESLASDGSVPDFACLYPLTQFWMRVLSVASLLVSSLYEARAFKFLSSPSTMCTMTLYELAFRCPSLFTPCRCRGRACPDPRVCLAFRSCYTLIGTGWKAKKSRVESPVKGTI